MSGKKVGKTIWRLRTQKFAIFIKVLLNIFPLTLTTAYEDPGNEIDMRTEGSQLVTCVTPNLRYERI